MSHSPRPSPSTPSSDPPSELGRLVAALAQVNCELWHREDDARSDNDAQVAQAKRDIDALNQRRNDLIEQIDDFVLSLAPQRKTG